MNQKTVEKIINNIHGDTYIIGDTHFTHPNILKYEPIRAETMKLHGFMDHDEWIVHQWNSIVKEDDVVLHIGDFAFKGYTKFNGMLNGTLILLIGNHDKKIIKSTEHCFDEIIRGTLYIDEGRVEISNDELFSAIVFMYEGKKIMISHYPATEKEKKWYVLSDEQRKNLPEHKVKGKDSMVERLSNIINLAKENDVEFNIHGHTHSKKTTDNNVPWEFVNCSLENIDFKPMKLKDVVARFINTKEKE